MTDTPEVITVNDGMESTANNDISSPKDNTEPVKTPLKELNKTQEEFTETQNTVKKIKQQIGSIIDSIAKNQSLFSRAAEFWGKIPLWLKIVGGVVLIAPTLILGIVIHISILIVISALTLIGFVATNYILDNHRDHDVDITDKLKKCMDGLADSLGLVIQSLSNIQVELGAQIDEFQQKNEQLTLKLVDLNTQVDKLSIHLEELKTTEKKLRKTQISLEKTTINLKGTVEEQTELLRVKRAELEQIQKDIEATQHELSEKVKEIVVVKEEMAKEINSAQAVANDLQIAAQSLAKIAITDDAYREEFQKKLDDFISDKEGSFAKAATRISKAEHELSLVRNELNRTNKRFQDLLKRQERQVQRVENETPMQNPKTISTIDPHNKQAATLFKIGLHAKTKKTQHPHPEEQVENLRISTSIH